MPVAVNFGLREELMKVVPTLSLCYQCGTCSTNCPITDDSFNIRLIIKKSQLGAVDPRDFKVIWDCVTCGTCQSLCPTGVEITNVIEMLRTLAVKSKVFPTKINEILWKIYENQNPWGYTATDKRRFLAQFGNLINNENPDVLIYPCCLSIGDPRVTRHIKALIRILTKAGLKVGMYTGLTCCGDIISHTGNKAFYEEYTTKVRDALMQYKAPIIVTLSPHCEYSLKRYVKGVRVVHYVELLKELIDSGKLKLDGKKVDVKVTYHDPCYLAKHQGVIEEPRQIIRSIPGVKLIEMEHSGKRALCCGAGGGGIALETRVSTELSKRRLKEALDTGASIMLTACTYCFRMFEDANKVMRTNIKIMDLAEFIDSVLGD
ncbi:(Fe-S)-binding protein [Vulcanisaeta thermophila]|uniref:(Fe-S)-binding protein n=1 Tax=Vulcanisaeta thermophila TaxID=867917 RepID=UPI0008538098|nr:(Fe-S)-binding protein [Vulcanisaeta thermophila]